MLPFPSGYSPLLASGAHYKWPAHQGRNVGVWLRLLVDHVAHKRGGEGNEDVLEGCQPGPIDKVPDAVLLPLGEAFVAKFRHTVTRDAPGDVGSGITLKTAMKRFISGRLQLAIRRGELPPNPGYDQGPLDAETAALLAAAKRTRRPLA
jgi:hypothetical protein